MQSFCVAFFPASSRIQERAVLALRVPPCGGLPLVAAARADTLLSTVKSIQRGDFPTRRAAAARAAPSTPRLMSAARVGPVVYGLLLTFRGGGYC